MAGTFRIGAHEIGDHTECYVIAEIGHNHQGSLDKAKELFRKAKDAGAHAVKLQKRDNRGLYTKAAYEKPYDNENSFGATYGEHREFLEFGLDKYLELQAYARELGIDFFSTAFDLASADFLAKLDIPAYKIASGDLKSVPLLKYVASFGKPMVISTGGALIEDVQRAYDAIMPINAQLAILQCTAGYPAAFEELDLRVINTFRERFPNAVVGFSSHDNGIAMPVAAYILGARIVEKHFTLNRASKGTDHAFSLEPAGLTKMVRDLERTHKAMGNGIKKIYDSEKAPIVKMGKSLVIARDLPAGHVLSREDIVMKSPGGGIPPYELDKVLGHATLKPLHADDFLSFEVLSRNVELRAFVNDSFRLDNQVAVVTGACGKLGPIWVSALVQAGAAVAALELTGAKSSEAFDTIAREAGDRIRRFDCDITDRASIEAASSAVASQLGVPTILVNNAGIDQPPDSPAGRHPLHELPIDQFRRMVEVNLLGTFQVIQVFGEQMASGAGGSIINIGSLYASVSPDPHFYDHLAGNAPFVKSPAYGASKAGVVSLSKFFATHWAGRGVRVNTLSPGGVLAGQDSQFKAKDGARVPLQRMAEADDLKGPLVFLASPASSYVTGHELRVDGGFTAW